MLLLSVKQPRSRTLLENQSWARHLRLRDDQLTPLKRDVPPFAGVSS